MNLKALSLAGILIAIFLISPAFAELPSRAGLLKTRYDEDRAKGLISLNRRYIDAYQKELNISLQAKKLAEANLIQMHIKVLKEEIQSFEEGGKKMTAVQSKANDASFLVGKTIGFPHNNDPSKLGYFSFQKGGEALWLGMKDQAISRKYRSTGKPRQFLLWWRPNNEERGDYQITVGPEGKTAEMLEIRTGKTSVGTIERTR